MPKIPRLRRQRQAGRTDRAFIEVDAQRRYLGPWGSVEASRRYAQVVAELAEPVRDLPPPSAAVNLRIGELIVSYLEHLRDQLGDDPQSPSQKWLRIRNATRVLFWLYGDELVSDLGPRMLATVRARWLEIGCGRLGDDGEPLDEPRPSSRTTANSNTQALIRMIRWGVGVEIVSDRVLTRCTAIEPLKRSNAEKRRGPKPIDASEIEAVRPFVSRQVWGLIRLIRLSGARPGEVVGVRPCDIQFLDESCWMLAPVDHKNSHRGQERRIYMGPEAIGVVRDFLDGRPLDRPIFSASEAVRELNDACRHHRSSPNPKPRTARKVGDAYTVASLRRAIARACEQAEIPVWSPHQLRHTRATELRRLGGIEVAKAVLGHASLGATEIYAARDNGVAEKAARRWG